MIQVEDLVKMTQECAVCIDGQYVPARPLPWDWGGWWSIERLKDAWEVFRGRADAVKWPGGQ